MDLQLFTLVLLDAVSYAALVFLVAVGLSLIFGVMRVLNVAHGAFYAIGAYTTATFVIWLEGQGASPWLSFPLLLLSAVIVGLVLGPLVEFGLLRRIYEKEEILQLLVTFALFMILEDVQKLVWGVRSYFADTPLQLLGSVEVAGVFYTRYQAMLLPAVAIIVLVGLRFFLRRTLPGKILTVVTEDREMAMALGINAQRVFLLTFTLGTMLAALGGALAAPTSSVSTGIAGEMIVLSFAVAASAGLGQIEGAALTALLIGFGRSLAVYMAPELDAVVPYLIMTAILLFRPQGMFGLPQARRV